VELLVDGRRLRSSVDGLPAGRTPLVLRLPRKRRPAAFGYLERSESPLEESRRGIAVSTRGKVIRRGWDWLGLTPLSADQVTGLIEAPELAGALTLNKADFLRAGPQGLTYLSYRKAIQQVVAAQLAEWGEGRQAEERAQRRIARPIERDLETVLVDLASDFPALSALVERHADGQRRLPSGETPVPRQAPPSLNGEPRQSARPTGPPVEARPGHRSRGGRYGLTIKFEERPDADELGRLIETTVWVNTAHPAFRRAVVSRAEGYHTALSVAMALAPLAADAGGAQEFLTRFLTRWGETAPRDGRRRNSSLDNPASQT
jgi:hypothetical protein